MKSLISAFSAGCASVGSETDNIKKRRGKILQRRIGCVLMIFP
ncbi:hypothetical protein [Methylobacter tundripaludum]|nr:hypothetical protein [Methylobacter tundripaludum]